MTDRSLHLLNKYGLQALLYKHFTSQTLGVISVVRPNESLPGYMWRMLYVNPNQVTIVLGPTSWCPQYILTVERKSIYSNYCPIGRIETEEDLQAEEDDSWFWPMQRLIPLEEADGSIGWYDELEWRYFPGWDDEWRGNIYIYWTLRENPQLQVEAMSDSPQLPRPPPQGIALPPPSNLS